MLKIAIVILFVAILISLGSGLVFLFQDQQRPGSFRTLYALGTRVILASSLLLLLFYGFASGQLKMDAPWHDRQVGHQLDSTTS